MAMPTPTTSLRMPAEPATIVRNFGPFVHERSKAKLSRRGMDLEVAANAPVVAPGDGTVRYAGVIRGLDNGVILDHGAFFSVIGKLSDLSVAVGDTVTAGQEIGRAARRRIYFEVRAPLGAGGTPVRPNDLMAR